MAQRALNAGWFGILAGGATLGVNVLEIPKSAGAAEVAGATGTGKPEGPVRKDLVVEALSPAEEQASHRGTPAATTESVASRIRFDEALTRILARNTAIATQQQNLQIILERNRPSSGAFAPTLSFDAKQTTSRTLGTDLVSDSRQLEVVSQLNLFRGGADWAGVQAARADEATQRAMLDQVWLQAEFDAVSSLVTEIARRQEISVLAGIVKSQEESLHIAEQRYAGGYLPRQELDLVSIDLANARARLADAGVSSLAAHAQLVSLMGAPVELTLEWPWKDALRPVSGAGTGGASEKSLERRPDWRAAQMRVEAEDRRTARNWRLLAPSLDLGMAYGWYSLAGRVDAGAPGWQGTVSLTLPILDRLSTYSEARAQGAIRARAEVQLEQTRRDAEVDWEVASGSLNVAVSTALAREQTVGLARSVYQDNLRRFKAGRIDANALAFDQSRLSESELLAIQGWGSAHLAYARLCKARGARLGDCLTAAKSR